MHYLPELAIVKYDTTQALCILELVFILAGTRAVVEGRYQADRLLNSVSRGDWDGSVSLT